MEKLRIAVLDDEEEILGALSLILRKLGHPVACFETPAAFFRGLKTDAPNVVFLDINLGTGVESGLDVLARLRNEYPGISAVVISGTGEIKKAVEAIKLGAREFIEKPLRAEPILECLAQIESRAAVSSERDSLLRQVLSEHDIIGGSKGIRDVVECAERYADLNEPVLITGESGTGKELVAANLHYRSRRRSERYHKINVASIPAALIEDQLFGHLKGAFTGADRSRDGILKSSGSSSLFMDEIGELAGDLQAKLLRAIQEREIIPIGGNDPIHIEARMIFATNRDLLQLMKKERFRSDLYYRISTLTINVPPLRDRKGDIPLLAEKFLSDFSAENNLVLKTVSAPALEKLQDYDFPGNIRELKNILIKAAVASKISDVIGPDDIRFERAASRSLFYHTLPLKRKKALLERKYIETQLAKHDYDLGRTAEALGVLVNNLYRKLHTLKIRMPK
jgi:two-component system nitrogen regulation response regulator NtrX